MNPRGWILHPTRRSTLSSGPVIAACIVATSAVFGSAAWAQSGQSGSNVEDVTVEEVKLFLDPTVMISGFDYTFEASFLPGSTRLYNNVLGPVWAVNGWTAFWVDIPLKKFSIPDEQGPAGIGDLTLGWGAIPHEDLSRRFTTAFIQFEALAPTGDPDKGTGWGTWVLAPGGAIALNPTDKFPVYIIGRYLHSLESLRPPGSDRDESDNADLRVRSLELTIQTVHILPKGFFVTAIPSFVFNFNQDYNLFSLGVGVGRALNRNFAISAGYVHHVAGRETFNQVVAIQLSVLLGKRKDE